MRIDQLAALVEVAKSGSINSASKKLHVTQQSLNKSLKKRRFSEKIAKNY